MCYPGIFLILIQSSAVRQYLGWVGQSFLAFLKIVTRRVGAEDVR